MNNDISIDTQSQKFDTSYLIENSTNNINVTLKYTLASSSTGQRLFFFSFNVSGSKWNNFINKVLVRTY